MGLSAEHRLLRRQLDIQKVQRRRIEFYRDQVWSRSNLQRRHLQDADLYPREFSLRRWFTHWTRGLRGRWTQLDCCFLRRISDLHGVGDMPESDMYP